MSQEDIDALKNAAAIIERFGGIRPMAAKVGAPVTTVQGWKKRDVIPGARRADVLKAANDNGIDLSDLLNTTKPVIISSNSTPKTSESAFVDVSASGANAHDDDVKITIEPILKPQAKPLPASFQTRIDTTHEDLMAAIAMGQKKAVNASLWTAAAFVITFAAGAAFVLWPSAQKIEKHDAQIASLESKVGTVDTDLHDMHETANFLKGMVPAEVQKKMTDLKTQADGIQKKVTDVAAEAEDIKQAVLATDSGSLSDRLSVIEAKLKDMQGGQALADLTARIRNLEVSMAGQEQMGASVDELRKIVDSLDGQVNTLDDKLAETKAQPGSPLGQTLEGVSGSDLKAAAMLIAFSQLRESLNRNEPFGDDVVLLQKLAGKDDPELQAALTKLAPQAEKGGILTEGGLSKELKTMTGDIVFSSLKGEDVSVTDKVKARISEIVNVKKDGKLVGGNPTQQAVAQAQSQLDSGDVQGAIATLQTLDGDAKTAAQPVIEDAQANLLAEQVQNLLRQTILAKVGTDVSTAGGTPSPVNIDTIKNKIEEVVPGQAVVHDEQSGFSVLPAPKGFKGFSPSQPE